MSILTDAQEAVDGARARDYGHPAANHGTTAEMFRQWRQRRYGAPFGETHFDAIDVCAFNIIQKLSRLANTPDHLDSLVDIAGYARNWEMVLGSLSEDEIDDPRIDGGLCAVDQGEVATRD